MSAGGDAPVDVENASSVPRFLPPSFFSRTTEASIHEMDTQSPSPACMGQGSQGWSRRSDMALIEREESRGFVRRG